MPEEINENKENDVVENQRTKVSSGIFSGGSGTLATFFTASALGDVSGSYYAVYNKVTSDSTSEIQFDIGYANHGGSGSAGNTTKLTSGGRQTAGMYRQFRNVLLSPNTSKSRIEKISPVYSFLSKFLW